MDNKDMKQIMEKAEVLIEALPYIQKFNRRIIVVKYGGSAMANPELRAKCHQRCDTFEAGQDLSRSLYMAEARRSGLGR